MAYQLVYTSSPKSLVMGRTGFSTVARTRDMPEKLAAAVERCGVYDIKSGEVFSHSIVPYAGENWHVLTRMTDSGTDYTNRNNYIAHHIVIADSEARGLANPAEILAQWRGWLSSWNENPQYIGGVYELEKIRARNSLPAKNWEAAFGSPTKAALIFGGQAQISARPSDARRLLALFSESMLLNVEPSDAWDITFTTSFPSGGNPSDFMWRAASYFEAPINLIKGEAPEAPANRAAQYAATGELNNRERYKLKISAPPTANMRFKVAASDSGGGSEIPAAVWVLSGAITAAALAIAAVFYFFSGESETKQAPAPLPSLKPAEAAPAPLPEAEKQIGADSEISLLSALEQAREKIGRDEYAEALKFWDGLKITAREPSLRSDLLADIAGRSDRLLKTAEKALVEGGDEAKKIAKEYVSRAEKALSVSGLEGSQKRAERIKILKEKIK